MQQVLYAYQKLNAITQRDIGLLEANYTVCHNAFVYKKKIGVLKALWKDFWQALFAWKKSDFSLIVVRFAGYHGLIPLMFARWHKIPSVVIVGGTDAACLPGINYGNYRSQLLGLISNLNFRLSVNAVFVHESLIYQKYTYDTNEPHEQGVQAFYKGPLKPYVVYNGYDSGVYKPYDGVERLPKSCITAAGNLSTDVMVRRKGVDIILKAARLCPDYAFTLVGSLSLPKHYYPLPENVVLVDFLERDELIKAFSSHQYYLQTSMFEGFPNALSEAMLCECIPIGSNVSGIPFIIDNTGFVIEERCEKALAEVLKSEAVKDGKRARSRIKQSFTWEMRVNQFMKAIDSIEKKHANND
jgi:glycosyltransferase involved in cell wall biosynthesis